MSTRVNPGSLYWFRQPQLYIMSADKLILETEPHTSMESFPVDEQSGFGLRGEPHPCFGVEMKVQFGFRSQEDECGLMLYLNEDCWFKCGIVSSGNDINELFCTRYSDGLSDRNVREIGSGVKALYFRAFYTKGNAAFFYSMNGTKYTEFRRIEFPDENGRAAAGLYACSPGNSYFDCTFSQMEIQNMEEEL